MSLAALLPGALGGTPILDAATELPLGTIVLLTEASLDAVDLERIPRLRECSPWAPIALLAAAAATPNRGMLRLLAGGGYVCVPDASSNGPSVTAIRNGVAARPNPDEPLVA